MPRKAKKPANTMKHMPIEYIKGVPNVLTSYVRVAAAKKARVLAGLPPSKKRWCVFCGRPFKVIQGLNSHLRTCEKRRIYKSTMAQGWEFTIGSEVFTIKTNNWSWIREAAAAEQDLNRQIAANEIAEDLAIRLFSWLVVGLQRTLPSVSVATAAAGIPEDEPSARSSPDDAGGDQAPPAQAQTVPGSAANG